MRMLRTVLFISFLTAVALIYVHQQVELVKLSYAIGCKEKRLKEILDHNEGLGYNIENLEDPARLEQVLVAKNVEVAFPKRDHIVMARRVNYGRYDDRIRAAGTENKINLFGILEVFSQKAEAQTGAR
jgi:hypothetical protein